MTVPGRVEAARSLLALDPPPWFLRHSRAVAEVAGWLAMRIASRRPIDRMLVEAGALLHDVDKLVPTGDALRALPHGHGSAAWLRAAGHPELAEVVRDHPVTRLAAPDASDWLATASIEAKVVAYADKRAGQRLEPMHDRFAAWRRRFPPETGGWDHRNEERALARARILQEEVCGGAGVEPQDVRRLRWTAAAIRTATAQADAAA